jgi:signal transduction histidine kinase/CheY-like chemotaxis protein
MRFFLLLLIIALFTGINAISAEPTREKPLHEIITAARQVNPPPKDRFHTLDALVNHAYDLYPPDTMVLLIRELLSINGKSRLADPLPYELMIRGQQYLEMKQYDSALMVFTEMIRRFDDSRRIFAFNSYLTSIGHLFNRAGKQKEKLDFYRSQLVKYTVAGPAYNTAACFIGIGQWFTFSGDYDQALDYYFRALEIYRKDSPDGFAGVLTIIGYTYYRWGNQRRALTYLDLADSAGRAAPDLSRSQLISLARALVMTDRKDYEQAKQFVLTASSITVPYRSAENQAAVLALSAWINLKQGKTEPARENLISLQRLTDSLDIPVAGVNGDFETGYLMYQYFRAIHNDRQAEYYLLSALREADAAGAGTLSLKYMEDLFFFYNSTGQLNKAAHYAHDYMFLDDSLFRYRNEENIARFEIEEAESRRVNEIRDLQDKKEKERWLFLEGVAVLLGILAVIFLRLWFVHRMKKKLEEKNRLIAAEKEFAEQMRLRAEKSEQFKQQFLANMSHEIRTPMNAVVGMTNLLIEKGPRSDQQGYLEGIRKSAGILLHIINDILDLAKIEAGKIELEKIDFSLRDVIGQVVQTMHHRAGEKGIALVAETGNEVPDVLMGDPVRINQILVNLTGNAIKFTGEGSVTIRVSLPGNDESTHPQTCEPGHKENAETIRILFAVSDTGIGIPEDKLDTIFEEFSQANASDTRKFGGTGLGLSISRQLVELMGGHIRVESRQGEGTTFFFEANFAPGSAERLEKQMRAVEEIDGSILDGLSLLIADDQEYNLVVACDTLAARSRVKVMVARNGREAIGLLCEHHFDAVLMDMQMPVMNGTDATRYIREHLPAPKNATPVIALTASVMKADIDRCIAAGMNGWVPKPFTAGQLIAGIAEALKIPPRYRVPGGRAGTGKTPGAWEGPPAHEAAEGPAAMGQPDASPHEQTATDPVQETNLDYLGKFCDNDRERMIKYIAMFLDAAPVLKAKLEVALGQEDLAEIRTQVHGFKTKWVMMGMGRARELADRIEAGCVEGSSAGEIAAMVTMLLEMLEKGTAELKKFCGFTTDC